VPKQTKSTITKTCNPLDMGGGQLLAR